MEDTSSKKRFNRKRKKSFLKNAKKYGKRGYYGRGEQLESDLYNYLVEISTCFKEINNDEEKNLFVNNVFQQLENKESNCCFNQVGCRVIESLLPFTSDSILEKFIRTISDDFRRFCSDTFASHVVETVFVQCYKRSEGNTKSEKFDFTLKLSKFLLNNLEDFVWNTYGNHIIRTILRSFAALEIENETKKAFETLSKNNSPSKDQKEKIPEEYKDLVLEYGKRLISWPQFLDLPYSDLTSGLLQVLIRAVAKLDEKLFESYYEKLLDDCFAKELENAYNLQNSNDNMDQDDYVSKPVVALLEVFIQCSPPKVYTQIIEKCFRSKLAYFAKERSTNFVVQKLLDKCKDKTEFESMFDELVDSIPEIYEKQHTGVIVSLGAACQRLSSKQGSYVQALMKLFNCFEPQVNQDSLVLCLSRWTNFENVQNIKNENLEKQKLHLHGTLIVQLILNFHKPIKIVNSILSLETNILKSLFSNTMGCHIVDSYMKSQYVGEKSREKLIRKMQGTYQELASSKHGSRAFDALWEAASFKMKLSIMEELAHKDASWSNSQFGKIIANKINLSLFKRNKQEWKNVLNKNKTSKSLIDIFND